MRTRPDATKEEPIHSSPALGNSRFKINPDCVLQVRLQGGSASRGMHSAGKLIKRTITRTPRRPVLASYHTTRRFRRPRSALEGCVHRWRARVALTATRPIGTGQPATRARDRRMESSCASGADAAPLGVRNANRAENTRRPPSTKKGIRRSKFTGQGAGAGRA